MATYYFRNTGDSSWGTATNWSATDGGGATGAVPTSSDNAIISSNSGNLTTSSTNKNCKALVFAKTQSFVGSTSGTVLTVTSVDYGVIDVGMTITGTGIAVGTTISSLGTGTGGTGTYNISISQTVSSTTITGTLASDDYTGTLTVNTNITVAGNITLSSSMSISGTSTLIVSVSSTIKSNGVVWPNVFQNNGSMTITLYDDWTVNTASFSGTPVNINGSSLYVNVRLSVTNQLAGTATIVMAGTGNVSGTSTAIKCNLTINTTGTITFTSNFSFDTGTFTYVAGTVVMTGITLTVNSNVSVTFNTSGMAFNNVTITGNNVAVTLSSNMFVYGTLTLSPSGTITVNGSNLNCATLSTTGTTGTISGTSTIIFYSTGTWSNTLTTGALRNNLEINTTGSLTIDGHVDYRSGSFTYTTGSVITPSGSNIVSRGPMTYNINGDGLVLGMITPISGSIIFTGNYGLAIKEFNCINGNITHSFASGKQYKILTGINLIGAASSSITLNSTTGSNRAVITLNPGAYQDVEYCNATDIDSSLGQTVWNFKGTNTNTVNWNSLSAANNPVQTKATIF